MGQLGPSSLRLDLDHKVYYPGWAESIICVGVGLSDKKFEARPYLARISSACSLVNDLAQISLNLGLT